MDKKYARYLLQKTKNDYQKIARHFAQTRFKPWPVMDFFVKKYVKDNDYILDLGCGNGRLLLSLKDRNIRYLGIDSSELLINEAKKKASELNLEKNCQFRIGDVLRVKLKNSIFDIVFMIALLPHIPSQEFRERLINKVYKSLREKGYLLVTCWNLFSKEQFKSVLKYNLLKILNKTKLDFNDVFIPWKNNQGKTITNRYYHAFTRTELKRLFEKAGFETVDIFYIKQNKKTSICDGFNLVGIFQKNP